MAGVNKAVSNMLILVYAAAINKVWLYTANLPVDVVYLGMFSCQLLVHKKN